MQKKLLILLAIIVCTGAIVWFLGFFPVARVNDEFLWYRAYNERADALLLFDSKSRAAAKNTAPSETDESEIRRIILQNLITEEIFKQYIEEHTALSGLREATHAVVESTLKEANPDVLPRATEELYGWSVEEFKKNVLYPQALQNELQKAIEADGASFDEFAKTQLQNAEVKLYLVPWKWEKGGLVSK